MGVALVLGKDMEVSDTGTLDKAFVPGTGVLGMIWGD